MKRIHVHVHGGLGFLFPRRTADEQPREPDGRFGAGGSVSPHSAFSLVNTMNRGKKPAGK